VRFTVAQTPTLNGLLRGRTAQVRRGKHRQLRETFGEELVVLGAIYWARKLGAGRKYVWITRFGRGGSSQVDYDNLVGGAKPLLDALVDVGLLQGDGADDVQVAYDSKQHTDYRTEVVIQPEGDWADHVKSFLNRSEVKTLRRFTWNSRAPETVSRSVSRLSTGC
jgi:hypothetical protein